MFLRAPILSAWLVAVLVASAAAQAQVRPVVTTLDYDVDTQTTSFDVAAIDFDRRMVVFRHVYSLRGDPTRHLAPSIDCGYEGLDAGLGEVWGLYDIGGDRMVARRVVAEPARTPATCTQGDLKARRAEASQAFLQQLSPQALLDPAPVRPEGRDDRFGVFNKAADRALSLAVVSRRVNEDDRRAFSFLDTAPPQVAMARLLLDEGVLYSRYQALDASDDIGRELAFTGLYMSADETRIVLLERFTQRKASDVTYTYFSFSAAIDLSTAWKERTSLPQEKNAPQPLPVEDKRPLDGDNGGESSFCSDACCCGACACASPAVLASMCGCALFENGCGPIANCILGKGPRDPDESPPPPSKTPQPAPNDPTPEPTPDGPGPKTPKAPPQGPADDDGEWTRAGYADAFAY